MEKKPNDVRNTLIAVFFLIATVISIPDIFIATILMGAVVREAFLGIIFSFSLIGMSIGAAAYIIKSISKKTVIFSKKGKEINVRNYIFLAAVLHLLIFLMAWGFTGLFFVFWLINVIISTISGILYQPYKEKSDNPPNNIVNDQKPF